MSLQWAYTVEAAVFPCPPECFRWDPAGDDLGAHAGRAGAAPGAERQLRLDGVQVHDVHTTTAGSGGTGSKDEGPSALGCESVSPLGRTARLFPILGGDRGQGRSVVIVLVVIVIFLVVLEWIVEVVTL